MTISYLDTSAAMKLVLDEPQSEALTAELTGREDRRLVSSWLLHTEMHCAAGRHPQDVDLEAVGTVLDSVSLIDLTRGDLLAAGTHAPLRSNDAIHLAVALRVGADEIVTYDGELAERASAAGLPVLSPDAVGAADPLEDLVRRGLVTPPTGPRTRPTKVKASGSVSERVAEQRR